MVVSRNMLIAFGLLATLLTLFGFWGIYSTQQAKLLSLELQQAKSAIAYSDMRNEGRLSAMNEIIASDQKKLAVYARTLGQLQAKVARLDQLGARLVDVAALDKSEFDFGLEPAFGGPRQQQPAFVAAIDLHDGISHMNDRLKQLSAQLEAVDFVLESKQSAAEARPHAWPTEGGWISSRFGPRIDPFNGRPSHHYGVDIANRFGAPIMSASHGVVTFAGKMPDFGYVVDVEHGYGYRTRYGHMGSIAVKVGDVVDANQLIGRVGSTGHSTGPHLHYEVRRFDELVDPRNFLPRG